MDLSFTISKDPGNIGSGKNEPRTGRRRSAGLTAAAAAAAALVFLLTGCGRIPGNPAESSTFPQESALAEETAVHAQTEAVPQTTDIPPDRVTWQETPDTPPDWVTWQEKTEAADLDGDGTAETLTLEGRSFTARRGEALLFETPEEWQTADLLHADIDRDGTEEAGTTGPSGWRRTTAISRSTSLFTSVTRTGSGPSGCPLRWIFRCGTGPQTLKAGCI